MADTSIPHTYGGLRVLIAGGGVAGLETMIGLRKLAGDLVDLELLAPEPQFWYRPLATAEPFGLARVRPFELSRLAEANSTRCTLDRLASVDPDTRIALTGNGARIDYDVLVIACGALPVPAVPGALTFRGPADTDAFSSLLMEAEAGDIRSIAFVVPAGGVWPLPLYELALLTATRLETTNREVSLTLVTSEPAPLSVFGKAASDAVRQLLVEHRIAIHSGARLAPGRTVAADRVVALPRLEGLRILGLPQDEDGFIGTDRSGRVHDLDSVFAVGDITQFPIRQGGLAALQADAAAEAIAHQAGASVEPRPFVPVLHGCLLTGARPLYLRQEQFGGGEASTASAEPLWWSPSKIAARYLSPFLAGYGEAHLAEPRARG